MEPSLSAESRGSGIGEDAGAPRLNPHELDLLVSLADRAVRAGLGGGAAPALEVAQLPPALRKPKGAFVTLEVHDRLNGCIGTLEPREPLGVAVSRCAWDAAFADPRLPALAPDDYPHLKIKVSVLGALTPIAADSEEAVLRQLRPVVDGLLLAHGSHRATFLPAVWSHLADPRDFLRHLEQKAGLTPGRWPRGMQAWRYRAIEHQRVVGSQ